MPVSSPNSEAGRWRRAARERLGLSTRDVERLSRQVAEGKQSQEYYISHAWVSEIEKGEWSPGIFKISSLSTIYGCGFHEIVGLYGVSISDLGLEQVRLPLPNTHLVGALEPLYGPATGRMATGQKEKTQLVSRMFMGLEGAEADLFPSGSAFPAVYGYIGTKDYTLFPVIRPGAYVQIDPARRRIETGKWVSPYQRPIYFVELRGEYACSWCEEREGKLLLVPYPSSGHTVREFRRSVEAEVIGRVTAVTMRITEPRQSVVVRS